MKTRPISLTGRLGRESINQRSCAPHMKTVRKQPLLKNYTTCLQFPTTVRDTSYMQRKVLWSHLKLILHIALDRVKYGGVIMDLRGLSFVLTGMLIRVDGEADGAKTLGRKYVR